MATKTTLVFEEEGGEILAAEDGSDKNAMPYAIDLVYPPLPHNDNNSGQTRAQPRKKRTPPKTAISWHNYQSPGCVVTTKTVGTATALSTPPPSPHAGAARAPPPIFVAKTEASMATRKRTRDARDDVMAVEGASGQQPDERVVRRRLLFTSEEEKKAEATRLSQRDSVLRWYGLPHLIPLADALGATNAHLLAMIEDDDVAAIGVVLPEIQKRAFDRMRATLMAQKLGTPAAS